MKAAGIGIPRLARLWAGCALVASFQAWAQEDVQRKWSMRANLDFGHIIDGSIPAVYAVNGVPEDASMLPLNRATVLAIHEASVGRFDVTAGLAGLIWWPFGGGVQDASERAINVKPMVPVARARWRFGDPASLAGSLQIGTFNHKYNPDAKNLGEYLYRAGTYPGFLWTNEGWLLMNRAGNYSHGAMLSLAHGGGLIRHNFSLFMETNYYPVGDFSPGYDFSITSRWLEIGGGAVLNHYLPLRPSALVPKDPSNAYIEASYIDQESGQARIYRGPEAPVTPNPANLPFDPSDPAVDFKLLNRTYWTHKGIKLMGRAALNLGHILPEEKRGPEDLRLFAEAAVLGWDDQPLYFENRAERIPIMFGINLPTFKLLDALTLQGEYYASPFNDINSFNTKSLPIWAADFVTDTVNFNPILRLDAQGRAIPIENHKDDFKWTVYAKKAVNSAMTVYAQAGSDHFRLTSGLFKASSVPLTATPREWYYLFRMEFALR